MEARKLNQGSRTTPPQASLHGQWHAHFRHIWQSGTVHVVTNQ